MKKTPECFGRWSDVCENEMEEEISTWWKTVRLVDCGRCPARDRCEHQEDDACCFGQWGRACNGHNACVDHDACMEFTEGTAVVVVEETE